MTTYYVRADGNDSATGLSHADAFQSLTKVRAMLSAGSITRGDTVLFRRGDRFPGVPGSLPSATAIPGGPMLVLGGYGPGKAMPVWDAYRVCNTSAGWADHGGGVWKIKTGLAGFTEGAYTGNSISTNADAGFLKVDGVIRPVKRWSVATLADPWDFYSDGTYTYVKAAANPTTLAADIRIAVGSTILTVGSNVVVAGIEMIGSGAHGIRGDGSADTVTLVGNYVHEIGGSLLSGTTRYGNGIEAWIGTRDWVVEHNSISDVYDVGYTMQGPSNGSTAIGWENMHARFNRIWNCNQSFELWAQANGFGAVPNSGWINCSFTDNVCINAGYAWSSEVRADQTSRSHLLNYSLELPMDVKVKDNVFFAARDSYFFRNTGDFKPPAGYDINNNDIFLRPGQKIQVQGTLTVEESAAWAADRGIDKDSRFYAVPDAVTTAEQALAFLAGHGGLSAGTHKALDKAVAAARARVEVLSAQIAENAARIPTTIKTLNRTGGAVTLAPLGTIQITNNYARFEGMFAFLPAGDSSRDKGWGFLKVQVQPQPPSSALAVTVDVFPFGTMAETATAYFRPSDFIAVVEESNNTTQVHTVGLYLNMRDDNARMLLNPININLESIYAKFTPKTAEPLIASLPAGTQVFGAAGTNNPYVAKGALTYNVLDYGAKGDGVADDTAAIQAAIDAAGAATGVGIVFLPRGNYLATTLTVKPYVTIRGSGRYRTTITAMPGAAEALIQFPQSMVQGVYIEDLQLAPGAVPNTGQHGVYAYALPSGSTGGWWYGGMRRVRVAKFDGHGLWLRGGGTDFMRPHQFLTFEGCEIFAGPAATSRSVYMTGQVGQAIFTGCELDGNAQGAIGVGTSIEIKRQVDAAGTVISDVAAYAIDFLNCTIQANALGARVERASTVKFDNCWFEDLASGVVFDTSVEMGIVTSCSFGDAGLNGSGTGYLIQAGPTSTVVADSNRFAGNYDRDLVANSSNGVIISRGNRTSKTNLLTAGMTKQYSTATIGIDNNTTALISSGPAVQTINSKHAPGDIIHLRAWTANFTLVSGGNINLAGMASPVVIPDGATVTLARMDLGVTGWTIISMSPMDPIIKSPNGTRFRIGVADDGALTTTSL